MTTTTLDTIDLDTIEADLTRRGIDLHTPRPPLGRPRRLARLREQLQIANEAEQLAAARLAPHRPTIAHAADRLARLLTGDTPTPLQAAAELRRIAARLDAAARQINCPPGATRPIRNRPTDPWEGR